MSAWLPGVPRPLSGTEFGWDGSEPGIGSSGDWNSPACENARTKRTHRIEPQLTMELLKMNHSTDQVAEFDDGLLRVMFVATAMRMGGEEMLLVELMRRMDRSRFSPELCCLKYLGPLGEIVARDAPAFD